VGRSGKGFIFILLAGGFLGPDEGFSDLAHRRPSPTKAAHPSSLSYNEAHKNGVLMTASVMVHVRVQEDVKTQAAQTLATMGLSISDAVRVFLTRIVAEQQLPFVLKVPNATTRAAMAEIDEILTSDRARFTSAEELFDDLEKNSRQ